MQRRDARADGINWRRQVEQDTESTHRHPGADAGQREGVCVCVCVQTGEQGK